MPIGHRTIRDLGPRCEHAIMRQHTGSWGSRWDHETAGGIMRQQVESWGSRWDHETAGGIMGQ